LKTKIESGTGIPSTDEGLSTLDDPFRRVPPSCLNITITHEPGCRQLCSYYSVITTLSSERIESKVCAQIKGAVWTYLEGQDTTTMAIDTDEAADLMIRSCLKTIEDTMCSLTGGH